MSDFGPGNVVRAHERIADYVHRTPVLHSRTLDAIAGASLSLKAENLQRTGSFKARGAFNALLEMPQETRARGIMTVSSGNHAQAVALAARTLGTTAVVLMPDTSTEAKREAAEAYGAEVVVRDLSMGREGPAAELSEERGLPILHPFDNWEVMAGQGTVALELTGQIDAPDAVVVPVGGGGLISGIATVVKERWPRTRVIGVEPVTADDARRSLEAGRRVSLGREPRTVADGVRVPCLGERPWTVISRLVDDIVTVTDDQTLAAMELVWTRVKTIVEPTGALSVAAVLEGAVKGSSLACVLSGGNADFARLAALRDSQQ